MTTDYGSRNLNLVLYVSQDEHSGEAEKQVQISHTSVQEFITSSLGMKQKRKNQNIVTVTTILILSLLSVYLLKAIVYFVK